MMTEPTGFAERLAERKASARRTLRDVSSEELQALVAQLFPDGTHPFAEPFSKFIQEHDHEKAVRGETSDGISFVYYPRANQGIWYITIDDSVSVGLLGPAILKALSEIAAETGRF
jgi:predicted extracellular nuclease